MHCDLVHLLRQAGGELYGGYGLDDLETRPHGTLGTVLVGTGEAEQHPDVVSLVLADESIVAAHDGRAGALIGTQYLSVLLGVEGVGELRRAHQVAEHDAKVTPLGSLRAGRVERPRRHVVVTRWLGDGTVRASHLAHVRPAGIRHAIRLQSGRDD